METDRGFVYFPESMVGGTNERVSQFSRYSWVHSKVRSKTAYELCSCGLMASQLEGNRGHRNSYAGGPATKGFFAKWDSVSAGAAGDIREAVFSCFCGEELFYTTDIPLQEYPELWEKHSCPPPGFGPLEFDARSRAIQDLHREIFFTYKGFNFRLGEPTNKKGTRNSPISDTDVLIYGNSRFEEAVSRVGVGPLFWGQVPRFEITFGGTQESGVGLLVSDPRELADLYQNLNFEGIGAGLDGYFSFSTGRLSQKPVLAPEYSFKTRKSLVAYETGQDGLEGLQKDSPQHETISFRLPRRETL